MARNGIHSLDDPKFLHACNEKRREASEKLKKNAIAKKASVMKKIQGVKMLHDKYRHESKHLFEPFSKEECSTYLQYKKQSNKNPGMHKDLQE